MALRRKTSAAPATPNRGNAAGPRAKAAAGGPGAKGKKGDKAAGSKPSRGQRLKQVLAVFKMTRQRDPKMVPWLLVAVLVPLAIGILLGILLGSIVIFTVFGLVIGLFVGLNIFSRRVQKTAYAEIEGKPGAAAGVVDRMRGDWRLTTPVQVNRNQDLVSRVVSRAGVILIAEGRGTCSAPRCGGSRR